jgi:short-subunit dehydrogenase involved in D-alanine esterification of teichoic acids
MSASIQRIVITGAGSGIGLDKATRFLRAESRVIINGRGAERLAQAHFATAELASRGVLRVDGGSASGR